MSVMVNYKTTHERTEFWDYRLDPRLRAFILELSSWQMTSPAILEKDRRPVVVTEVYRTPEENKAVSGHPYSGHMDWRCIDFRANDLRRETINVILARTSRRFPKIHLICHGEGPNKHFHAGILYADRIAV